MRVTRIKMFYKSFSSLCTRHPEFDWLECQYHSVKPTYYLRLIELVICTVLYIHVLHTLCISDIWKVEVHNLEKH